MSDILDKHVTRCELAGAPSAFKIDPAGRWRFSRIPLLGTADYRPLTRGLVAALPYVDDFLPARTLRNLEDLAAHLNRLPDARPLRRQGPDAA